MFRRRVKEIQDDYGLKVACAYSLGMPDVPSTLEHNMNLIQVGSVAMNAKYIIAIASSPIIYCFNKWNIDTTKKWVVLSNRSTYTYNDRIIRRGNIKGVDFAQLFE